jgi:hypothetical protein
MLILSKYVKSDGPAPSAANSENSGWCRMALQEQNVNCVSDVGTTRDVYRNNIEPVTALVASGPESTSFDVYFAGAGASSFW